MKRKTLGYIFLALFIFVTLYIFHNSFQNATESSSQSSRIVDIAEKIIKAFKPDKEIDRYYITYFIRKTAHFAEFFIQGVLFSAVIYIFSNKYNVINILFTGLLTACCDEFIQLSSDGRSAQITDVFVDFSGCIAAAVLYSLFYYFTMRKNKL